MTWKISRTRRILKTQDSILGINCDNNNTIRFKNDKVWREIAKELRFRGLGQACLFNAEIDKVRQFLP